MHKFIEAEARKSPSPKSSSPHVLLVEDAIISQLLIRKQLEQAKYSVVAANNGTEALRQYKLYNNSIKVVIMDINMPGMTGIETTSLIREIQRFPLLIYALTGNSSDHLEQYIEAGMNGYFQKGEFSIYMFEQAIQLSTLNPELFITKQVIEDHFMPTLLLVDDMKVSLKGSMNSLKKSGYIVDCATSGTMSIERYLKYKNTLQVILMDINMPDMSGCDVTIYIRNYEKENKLPKTIIFGFTSNVTEENLKEYMESGMDGCIGKGQNLFLALSDAIDKYNSDPSTFVNITNSF